MNPPARCRCHTIPGWALRFAGRERLCSLVGVVAFVFVLSGCVEIRVPNPNVRYIAFGDSTTAGPSTRDYPEVLGSLLGLPTDAIVNEGLGGEMSEDGLGRLSRLIGDGVYPNAEVLIYWEGGNDVTGFIRERDPFLLISPDALGYPLEGALAQQISETQANIESAVEAAQRAGLEVYVATYFPLREDVSNCDALPLDVILPSQVRNANAYVLRLNEGIRAAAGNQEVVLVDIAVNNILSSDPANYTNCNHLSEQGNAIAAAQFRQAIVTSRE